MLLRKLVNEREQKKTEMEGLKHRMKNMEYRLSDLKRRTHPKTKILIETATLAHWNLQSTVR